MDRGRKIAPEGELAWDSLQNGNQCPPSECDAPGEELEDPIEHYRAWEAMNIAKELTKLGAAGDLTGQIGTLFGTLADFIDGYVEAPLTAEVAIKWIDEYSEFLEACVEELHSARDSHGGCGASYDNLGPVPDFYKKPEISYCLVGTPDNGAIGGLALSYCTLLGYSDEAGAIGVV